MKTATGFTRTEALPQYLKEHGLFCLWRYELDAKRSGWTKLPYNPKIPRECAAANDRKTFSDMRTAEAAGRTHNFDGIGIGVFDSVAAIDIDHCVKDGKLSAMASDIVEIMDTYTELSPSGEGIRILFLAPGFSYDKSKYYINNRKNGLEIYLPDMTEKYVTVTGVTIRRRDMLDRSERLQGILDKYMKRSQQAAKKNITPMPGTIADISDTELIEKAKQAKNGAQFAALWMGDYSAYPSPSEADQALCNKLAFWTGRDADRMDRLFRQSGLMRDKWDRRQSATTYGAITIQKAIDACEEVYIPPQKRAQAAQEAQQQAREAATGELYTPTANAPQNVTQAAPAARKSSVELFDMFMEKVQTDAYRPIQTGMVAFDELLRGGIPRQSLVILSAAPGTGKTTLAQQIFEAAAAYGTDVVFFNLEMSREQLLARSISRLIHRNGGSISASAVMRGYSWTEAQRRYIEAAAAKYREEIAPRMQYNPDGSGAYISSIIATLESAAQAAKDAGKPAPVCVLDYLHLIKAEPGTRVDQTEIIKSAVEALKSWAIKYDSYVFAISANNRSANSSGVISLDSGRDSSAIEYTGDIALSLNYRELHEGRADARKPDDMERLQREKPRHMMIQVLKNRMNEPGGKLYLAFDAANSVFTPEIDQTPPPMRGTGFMDVNDPNLSDF